MKTALQKIPGGITCPYCNNDKTNPDDRASEDFKTFKCGWCGKESKLPKGAKLF